jgi:hypothetical protein
MVRRGPRLHVQPLDRLQPLHPPLALHRELLPLGLRREPLPLEPVRVRLLRRQPPKRP